MFLINVSKSLDMQDKTVPCNGIVMRTWIIILIAVVVVAIAAPAVAMSIAVMPFLGIAEDIDKVNSIDVQDTTDDLMEHPAAIAYMQKHPEYDQEFNNFGVGGTELLLMSEGGQLTLSQDTEGNNVEAVYICFGSDGSSDSVEGPNVAQSINTMC